MHHQSIKLTAVLCCLVLGASLWGCAGKGGQETVLTANGLYFDTSVSLTIETEEEESGRKILDGCLELCEELEKTFSPTDPDSELYQVNHRSGSTVEISEDLAQVIGTGLEFYALTDGKLDMTIRPVLELWDFRSGSGELPDPGKISEALEKVDGSSVHLSGTTLTFDREDTQIDLGALAKGYAADRLKAFLEEQGVRSAQINLGGNVQTIGERPGGGPWRVGIQKPFADRGTVDHVVEVEDKSVVCAGTYERCFEKDGVLYHHILDPSTGWPVQNGLAQVTVVCGESLTADALSTSCLLLGEEGAEELLEAFPEAEVTFARR
jgi:thiamine biosynthesis lipoprotein